MKKNNIRDYTVAAFRYYSSVLRNGGSSLPENSRLASACLLDLAAMEKTVRDLKKDELGKDILRAVETVYFPMPEREIKKGEISSRVIKASMDLHTAEPTIYRYLNKASVIFAENRGLRVSLF